MANFAPSPKEYPIVNKEKFITRPWIEHFTQMSDIPQPIHDEFNDESGRLTLPWLEWFHKIQVVPWPPLAVAVVPGSQPGDTSPPGGGMTSEEFQAYIEGMGTGAAGGIVTYGQFQVTQDCSAGHPGFNGSNAEPGGCAADTYLKDSTFCFAQILRWLIGKTQGSLLILQQDPPAGLIFGQEFIDAMEGENFSIQLTGDQTKFKGYEPLDYDCVLIGANLANTENYHGITNDREAKIDYIVDHRGHILGECSSNFLGPSILGYGVDWSVTGGFTVGSHGHQKPVTGSIFYPGGTISRVFGNSASAVVTAAEVTKGGTSEVEYCPDHPDEGVFHWWRKDSP